MTPFRMTRAPRPLPRAAGLAVTAFLGAALLAWAPQTVTGWNQGSAEATLWQLMNGARVNNGVRAVQQHSTLVSLARWRSKDQVDRDYFDHTILGTGQLVYHWYDLNGLSYSWAGENIGWNNGYPDADSPVSIHQGFMNSPSHRANVLEPSFTHGGVGAYAADNVMFLGQMRSPRFYTQLFMTAAAAAPPPPPPPPPGNTTPPPPPTSSGGGTQPAAPAATPAPEPSALRVDAPAAPRAGTAFDGGTVVAAANVPQPVPVERALARVDPHEDGWAAPVAAAAASSVRVEAASAPDGGVFEAVLGSLLGFFL